MSEVRARPRSRKRAKKAYPIPENTQGLFDLVHRLGEVLAEHDANQRREDERILDIQTEMGKERLTLEGESVRAARAILAYAESHWSELSPDERKSVEHATGVLRYMTTQRLILSRGEDVLIAALEKKRRHDLIVVKKSLNKRGLQRALSAPSKPLRLRGARVASHTTFSILPENSPSFMRHTPTMPARESWRIEYPKIGRTVTEE